MKKDFEILRKHYGSHVAAARAIGVSATHYRRFRNQQCGSNILKSLVAMKANEIRQLRLIGK